MTYSILNLSYPYITLLFGSFFFTYVVFLSYKKIKSILLILLVAFCLAIITYTLIQIFLVVAYFFIWVTDIVVKIGMSLFHVGIGSLIIYLNSLRQSKTRKLNGITLLLVIVAIIDIFLGKVYVLHSNNYVIIFPKGSISSIIIAFILIVILSYEVLILTKQVSRKIKITGIMFVSLIFMIIMKDYLCVLMEFLGFKNYYSILLLITKNTYVLSSLIFITISIISVRDFRFLVPLEVNGIFIVTKLGLTIASKPLCKDYENKMSTYSSLLATILALTEGLHFKRYSNVYQVYDTGVDLLLIYYGKKSVCTLIVKNDNLIIRDILKRINKRFEERVGSISDTVIDQKTIEIGERVIDSFKRVFSP